MKQYAQHLSLVCFIISIALFISGGLVNQSQGGPLIIAGSIALLASTVASLQK